MSLLIFTLSLNSLLMFVLPVLLAIFLARKFGLTGRLWWIGAATFLLSQVGHIPFNFLMDRWLNTFTLPPENIGLLISAALLGLSAGLWEEITRYGVYRWWARDARSWPKGLMLGAGHGGIEAMIIGGLALLTLINMIVARNMDLSTAVPADQLVQAQRQIAEYWSTPWYASLLGAIERVFTIIFHLAASVMVLQVFIRKQMRWLWMAVGWHALMDGLLVYTLTTWGPYQTEAMLAGFTLVSLAFIFLLRPSEPDLLFHENLEDNDYFQQNVDREAEDQPHLPDIAETPENLDQTRYS